MSIKKVMKSFCLSATFLSVLAALFVLVPCRESSAFWVWSPETGRFINPEGAVQDTAEEQFSYAINMYDKGDRGHAIEELEKLVRSFPGAKITPDAQLQLAVFLEEQQEFKRAFENYQAILKNYPQYERQNEILRHEYDLGHIFLTGARQKILGMPILPALPLAVRTFQHIIEVAPFSEYGDESQYYLGVALKKSGQYQEAIDAFRGVEELYPKSEFVTESNFQAAETQLLMSSTVSRDQQGLTEANKQFEDFLREHPDAPEIEKATALKHQAEEQHARKNFDIAAYYEDRSYLDSARIYYQNVAGAYPDTHWGAEAGKRLERLKNPVQFWVQEKDSLNRAYARILDELEIVTAKLASGSGEKTSEDLGPLKTKREQLKKELTQVRKQIRELEDKKRDDIKNRRALLERQRHDLEKKHEALNKKKKALRRVDSEDLKKAFDRWYEALKIEEGSLGREQGRLDELARVLDVRSKEAWTNFVPFRPGELDVRKMLTRWKDELDEIKAQRALLDERRSSLANERESIVVQLESLELRRTETLTGKEDLADFETGQDRSLEGRKKQMDELERNLADLEARAVTLTQRIRRAETSPISKIWQAPLAVLSAPAELWSSVRGGADDGKEELLKWEARERKLGESIKEQEEKIALIRKTMKQEQTAKEEKAGATVEAKAETVSKSSKPEKREIRRRIKQIERSMREVYRHLDDHRILKNRKIDELDTYLKKAEGEAARKHFLTHGVFRPFKSIGRVSHAFIFGLKEKEEFVQEDATKLKSDVSEETQEKIKSLQEEIEFENILIANKRQELLELKRQRTEANAQASSAGGVSFQSLLVDQPYEWLKYSMIWANRFVPHADAQKLLSERYGKEKEKYDSLKTEWEKAELRVQALRAPLQTGEEGKSADQNISVTPTPESIPDGAKESESRSNTQHGAKSPRGWRGDVRPSARPALNQTSQLGGRVEYKVADDSRNAEIILREMNLELENLKQEISNRQRSLANLRNAYHKEVKGVYEKSVVREKVEKKEATKEEKTLHKETRSLEGRLHKVNKELRDTIHDEHQVIEEEQRAILDRLERITDLTTKQETTIQDSATLLHTEAAELNQHLEKLETFKGSILEDEKQILDTSSGKLSH